MKILVAVLLLSSFSWAAKKTALGSCTMSGNYMVCGNHLASHAEISDWIAAYNNGTLPKSKTAPAYRPETPARTSSGRIARSPKSRSVFLQTHVCPSTGKSSGKCPGYVIDHVVPLACGGADEPTNMQFQTKADGKAKDKWERKSCGK